MAKKFSTKTTEYNVSSHAFSNARKVIPGTAAVAGKENFDFYSIKNTIPDKALGKICSKIAYKIGFAVANSRKAPEILCVGMDEGKKYYYGSFNVEDKLGNTEEQSFLIYPEDKEIFASTFTGESLYTLIMAMDIAEFAFKGKYDAEDAEIFEQLNKLNLNGVMIDTDQLDVFTTLCDSIYFAAKNLNGTTMTYMSSEAIQNKVLESDIKYNLIGLVSDYDELELEDGVIVPEMKAPKVKRKKSLTKSKTAEAEKEIDITDQDLKIMSDEEAEEMPEILQVMRKQAIEFYENNKEFLTTEQKSIIKSFKRGKIWKLGLYGPSATGKTSFVKSLAGALGLPYMIVVGSKGMDETALFGKYMLKDGETIFEYGPLTLMMKYGGLFLLDEENMVAPEVISSMNSVLDDTRLATLDSGEVVQCHENFRYCEAMNMTYAGTLEQNLSHESRIQMYMKMSGYSEKTEADLVVKMTGIDKATALDIVRFKNRVTDMIENGSDGDDTTQRVDLRSCIAWADRTIDCDGDVVQAALTTILSGLVKEDDNVKSSATVEDYEQSQELAAEVVADLKDTFKKKKMLKQEYEFTAYSL